jgi:hypothetical protein
MSLMPLGQINLLQWLLSTGLTKGNGLPIMTPQLESLMQQAIQLDSFACASGDRDEKLELITHLANSLHSNESHDIELVLTDLQKAQLKQL